YALPEHDVVDELVALIQLHLGDLLKRLVHLLGAARSGAADAERADIEMTLRLPFLQDVEYGGIAAGDAEGREPGATHVPHQRQTAGLETIGRDLRESCGNRSRGRDVSSNHTGRLSRRVANDRAFDEVGRVRRIRLDPERFQT